MSETAPKSRMGSLASNQVAKKRKLVNLDWPGTFISHRLHKVATNNGAVREGWKLSDKT